MLFYQRRFRRGSERTVAWLEARGGKVSAQVELKSLDALGAWIVETLQRLNRTSLSSIMKNIV